VDLSGFHATLAAAAPPKGLSPALADAWNIWAGALLAAEHGAPHGA
jgi:hypothetical protein